MRKPSNHASRHGQHQVPQATLEQHIDKAIISLSTMIHIPEEHAPTHLNRFITDYYQYMQREFRSWAEQDDSAPGMPNLHVHLERSRNAASHPQLDQLGEAYIAMRVLEEVNDHYIGKNQQPLTRYDISIANVIAGTLLGEHGTDRAEQIVNHLLDEWNQKRQQSSAAQTPDSNAATGTSRIYYQWPCLASQFGFSSSLADLPTLDGWQVSAAE